MNGAALSTLFTYFAMFLIMYYYSQKIYKIKYEWKLIFRISILTGVFYLLSKAVLNNISGNINIQIIMNLVLIILFFFIINKTGMIRLKSVKDMILKRNSSMDKIETL